MTGNLVGLAIETSGNIGSVALGGTEPAQVIRFTEGLAHGKLLLPSMEKLLKDAGLKAPDFVAVGVGPGSYTGLRIGVTVARTMAWTWECPLLGISSLSSIAAQVEEPRRPIVTLVDARQGDVYAAVYHQSDGVPQVVLEPFVGKTDEVKAEIPRVATFVGDGCARLGLQPTVEGLVPDALSVLNLARQRYMTGERDRIQTVLPQYLKRSEAERRLEAM